VLTAVVAGDVVFAVLGTIGGHHRTGREPAVRVAKDQRRQGNARTLCAALLSWGAERGASRSNAQVLAQLRRDRAVRVAGFHYAAPESLHRRP
jgi:N-acetylglutamate synthase